MGKRYSAYFVALLTLALLCATLAACNSQTAAQTSQAEASGDKVLTVKRRWWKWPAKAAKSPVEKLIEGPVSVTTEWTTFKLSQPLKTVPHFLSFNVLLPRDEYHQEDISPDHPDYATKSTRDLLRTGDGLPIHIEVRLVERNGQEVALTDSCCGWMVTSRGDFLFVGFHLQDSDGNFLYYPRDAQYTAIKVRANIQDITISHFIWSASRYYQNPDATWEDRERRKNFTFRQYSPEKQSE